MRTLWRNRRLMRSMVRRDILARYRGSFAGAVWTFLNPLLLMATYFFVFGVVMESHIGADRSRSGFRNVDRKSTRLNSSHQIISYAVFCLKKKKHTRQDRRS